jgi:histidinol dehydrogenase
VTKNAEKVARKVRNAGAIFIGPYSCVAAGDYASGANHVLPTGGTAKYSSQLSVRDFMKSSSVQKISREGLCKISTTIMTLAQEEGLPSHRKSVEERLSDDSVKG